MDTVYYKRNFIFHTIGNTPDVVEIQVLATEDKLAIVIGEWVSATKTKITSVYEGLADKVYNEIILNELGLEDISFDEIIWIEKTLDAGIQDTLSFTVVNMQLEDGYPKSNNWLPIGSSIKNIQHYLKKVEIYEKETIKETKRFGY